MRIAILGIFLLSLVLYPSGGSATRQLREEGRGCDSFVWYAHGHAAWMGAQRDIEFSEEILLKPDSILQYSCFNGKNPLPILTEGLPQYIKDNFGNAYANGELCVNMAKIWHSLKCRDFNKKHFMTYEDLTTFDPRVSYYQCETPVRSGPAPRWGALQTPEQKKFVDIAPYPPNTGKWAASFKMTPEIKISQSLLLPAAAIITPSKKNILQNNLMVRVQENSPSPRRWGRSITHAYPPPGTPPINGAADAVVTYNKQMYASSGKCSDAFPVVTGVPMVAQNRDFPDVSCSVPGCFFNGSACVEQ